MHPVQVIFASLIFLSISALRAQSVPLPTLQSVFSEKNNITRKDPNFPYDGELFTGFITVDNTSQANLFYQLYAYNQTTLSTPAPLIIWLQGGPGCSSSFGNYVELGPVHIWNGTTPSSYIFFKNQHTWNQYGHLLFVDNPTGTGFSRANGLNVSSTEQASKHFQIFLARFYQLYPEFVNYPLYIAGESYGGKYVPQYTYDLLQNDTFTSEITIAGIAIGDGWSDPIHQLPTSGSFGYAAGLIDTKSRDLFRMQEAEGIRDILNGDYYNATNIADDIMSEMIQMAGDISSYNYRDFSNSDEESSASDAYISWLNTTEAQAFLEIPYEIYNDCNSDVSDNFYSDNSKSVADLFPELISRISVLLYNGQDDDNCDYEGQVNFLNALKWKDIDKFRHANRVPWKLTNGTTAGLVKAYGNLTFLLVFKSGHMVPVNQPEVANEMIHNFIHRIPFD